MSVGAETLGLISIVLGTTSIVLSGGALAWILLRSLPAQLVKTSDDAWATSVAAARDVEAIKLDLTSWKASIENIADTVEDTLQRAETKRRRAVQSENRQNGGGAGGHPAIAFENMDRASQVNALRGKVFG